MLLFILEAAPVNCEVEAEIDLDELAVVEVPAEVVVAITLPVEEANEPSGVDDVTNEPDDDEVGVVVGVVAAVELLLLLLLLLLEELLVGLVASVEVVVAAEVVAAVVVVAATVEEAEPGLGRDIG